MKGYIALIGGLLLSAPVAAESVKVDPRTATPPVTERKAEPAPPPPPPKRIMTLEEALELELLPARVARRNGGPGSMF